MSDHAGDSVAATLKRAAQSAAVVVMLSLSVTASAQQLQIAPAQQAAPPQQGAPPAPDPSPPAPQAAPVPPAKSNPGLVEEIGKLFDKSVTGIKDSASGLTSKLPSTRETIDGLNSSAKDAADSLTRLNPIAAQTMVSGRAACPAASNGAPDCKAASDRLCKDKGYKEGKSLDVETAEKCSARVYLSGRTGAPGECRTENFVTRAVCQ